MHLYFTLFHFWLTNRYLIVVRTVFMFFYRFLSVPFYLSFFCSFRLVREKTLFRIFWKNFSRLIPGFFISPPPCLSFLCWLFRFDRNLFMKDWTSRGSSRNINRNRDEKFSREWKIRESCRLSLFLSFSLSSLILERMKMRDYSCPGKIVSSLFMFFFFSWFFSLFFYFFLLAVVKSADSFLLPLPVEKRSKNSLRVGWKLDRYRHLILYVVVVDSF